MSSTESIRRNSPFLGFVTCLMAAGATACARPSVAPAPLGADSVSTRVVAPGVVHRRLVIDRGPWVIHVVEVDLRRRDLELRAEHAYGRLEGREKTSALARRVAGDSLDGLVAMNADFFSLRTGEAIGNQIIEGRLVTGVGRVADPNRPIRSQFALSRDRRPFIERFVLRGTAYVGADSIPLVAVNTPPVADAVVLRTWPAPDTLAIDTIGDVRTIRLARVTGDSTRFTLDGPLVTARESRLSRDGALLVARGKAADALSGLLGRAGDRSRLPVRIVYALEPSHDALRTLVGGWPRLVVNGVSVGDSTSWHEGASRSFIVTRHPRTGIGFSRDSTRLYLAIVDGRQRHSAGMTIAEFAEAMRALGAWQALNLDGGGSTTLVIRDSIVNSPSDAEGERPVGNALVLVRRR